MKLYADIAFRRRIPSANDGLFTFAVPEKLLEEIKEGCIVLAPLRGETEHAVVVRLCGKKPVFETEEILEIRTDSILEPWQFLLAEKVAEKNFVPLARVLPLMIPNKIFTGNGKPPEKTIVSLTNSNVEKRLGKAMISLLKTLSSGGKMEISELLQESGGTRKTIERLEEKGLITLTNVPLSAGKGLEIFPFPNKGVFHCNTENILENSFPFPELSAEQKKAYEELKKHPLTLLFAPTGSGKSHILRMLAAEKLKQRKTALLLVPEIGLTEELVVKCADIFGEKLVAVYHSRLSEGEKAKVFWRVKTGSARIIVGSRASLFLPFQNLGLIAVEEEHEWTFKSDQSPRYHARDVALNLADLHNAQLVFSSATPGLETYKLSVDSGKLSVDSGKWQENYELRSSCLQEKLTELKQKKLSTVNCQLSTDNCQLSTDNCQLSTVNCQLVSLPSRIKPPKITLVNLREETMAKNPTLISRTLQMKMQEVLGRNEQVLLFLNRRGFHRALICQDCFEIVRCLECGISLVLHAGKGREFLLCHYCGKVFGVPERCGFCASARLEYWGSGTEKIERIVKNLFPQKKIIRIDRDTTANKTGFSDLYSHVVSGEADILIGTQIIAKGLDFENVSLVGILDADAGLHIPDFRSSEKTYQILTQVIGRAGRRGKPAEVVLQTRLPENPLFSFLQKGDTEGFLNQELSVREQFFLPPFSRIIKLIFVGHQKDAVFQRAREAEVLLNAVAKSRFPEERIEISVAPALHPKKHGKFYGNVLITAKNPEKILRATPLKGCRVDNDPVDVVG